MLGSIKFVVCKWLYLRNLRKFCNFFKKVPPRAGAVLPDFPKGGARAPRAPLATALTSDLITIVTEKTKMYRIK